MDELENECKQPAGLLSDESPKSGMRVSTALSAAHRRRWIVNHVVNGMIQSNYSNY